MEALQRAIDQLLGSGTASLGVTGLVVAAALIVTLRLLMPRDGRRRLRAPVGLFLAHLVFVMLAAVVPPQSGTERLFRLAALFLLLICIGRTGFLLFVDTLLGRRLARPMPKIFRDILEGLVYALAVLATLRAAGAEVDALLTTSALLTAVIGLSLQDTLGNLFAGLSIQAQNPFEVGDWIQFGDDSTMIGQVVEINWRATKVLTLDQVEVVMPNGPLAKAPIRNFTKPTPTSRRSIRFVVPFANSPGRMREVIIAGLRDVPGVLKDPAPTVLFSDFTERGPQVWVRFFTNDFRGRELVDARARERIWYALRRAEIEFAVPVADLDLRQDDERSRRREAAQRQADRERALRGVDFCRVLAGDQLRRLAELAHERVFADGELIIRVGECGEEFFIIDRGEVAVEIYPSDGEPIEVARLQPGSFFGEMSVMTGEPRTASVRSLGESSVLVVDKRAFQPILASSPELAERISEVLAARQEELDTASSQSRSRAVKDKLGDRSGLLLDRIREFFSI